MRHHVAGRKLGRTSAHRKAMFANMASSLLMHDRIETTLPKAKELRPLADRLVTLGKRATLHARRQAVSIVRDKVAVHRLFAEIAGRFTDRNGGYTRILKLGNRLGDCAPMAILEYVESGKGADAAKHSDEHAASKKKATKKPPVKKTKVVGERAASGKKTAAAKKSAGKKSAKNNKSKEE